MTPLGLAPGQQWTVAPGPRWQARLDRNGRAHVIGEGLAWHPEYRAGYRDTAQRMMVVPCGHRPISWPRYATHRCLLPRPRPWHDFRRACRAAAYHERMVLAAKQQVIVE